MANKALPSIGIIDSGLGGLTVYNALKEKLPNKHFIYFADTKYLPYGPKSPREIQKRAHAIASFFQKQNIDLLIIACHTLGTCASLIFDKAFTCPVISIHHLALEFLKQHDLKHLGILATKSTIGSSYYQSHLMSHFPNITLTLIACPLFVKLVEKGWHENYISFIVSKAYLRPFSRNIPDALFLGCTHFPFLTPMLIQTLPHLCPIIDPTNYTAQIAYKYLSKASAQIATSPDHFFISKNPRHFEQQAHRLLKNSTVQNPRFFYTNI